MLIMLIFFPSSRIDPPPPQSSQNINMINMINNVLVLATLKNKDQHD